MTDRSRNIAYL